MDDADLIRRVDARRILEEEGFLERSLANLNDLPAMQVAVKPGEGPQNRAIKTCKGCKHFHSEYWREPSGDGETWDSGTSATCLKANATISTYSGSEPSPPSWCPCAALTATPAIDPAKLDAAVEALKELLQIRAVWADPHNDQICKKARAALAAMKDGE